MNIENQIRSIGAGHRQTLYNVAVSSGNSAACALARRCIGEGLSVISEFNGPRAACEDGYAIADALGDPTSPEFGRLKPYPMVDGGSAVVAAPPPPPRKGPAWWVWLGLGVILGIVIAQAGQ